MPSFSRMDYNLRAPQNNDSSWVLVLGSAFPLEVHRFLPTKRMLLESTIGISWSTEMTSQVRWWTSWARNLSDVPLWKCRKLLIIKVEIPPRQTNYKPVPVKRWILSQNWGKVCLQSCCRPGSKNRPHSYLRHIRLRNHRKGFIRTCSLFQVLAQNSSKNR